ncbi:MAG: lysoplasmalogenase [Kineosporiaceae bacterium]|nr:lysoplasmalogenase [Aeromicrobium sp.]
MSAVHLTLNAAGASPWDSITKCLIMPLLAVWVFTESGPRIIVIALVASTIGDFFMELEGLVTLGMAAFAVAHVCFIGFFVSHGALGQLRKKPWIGVIYVAAAIALVSYVWSGLENDMLPLVPVYAALLAATAATSLATDLRAGIGGALFLVSDAIIALDLANKGTPQPVQFWIMAFYISALFMLSAGILNREKATRVAGPDINPTLRADGWPPMKAV